MKARTCPVCKAHTVSQPGDIFCSARCKQVDLARWFSGTYVIKGIDYSADVSNPEVARELERVAGDSPSQGEW